ncbi:Hypothetical protein PFR_JS8_2219 [Propionibacterium freudenreichii]|nr:Hypothetical protein PFR_JS8_2219 [Propionibacterium freudenreichii]
MPSGDGRGALSTCGRSAIRCVPPGTAQLVSDGPLCLRRPSLSPTGPFVSGGPFGPCSRARSTSRPQARSGAFIPSGSAYVTLIRSIAYAADVHAVPCGRPFVTHSGACFAEMVSFGTKRTPPCPFGTVPSRHHVKNGCGVRILRREGMGVCPDGGAGSGVGTGSPTRQHRRAPKLPLSSCRHPRGPRARSPGTPSGSGGSGGPGGPGSPPRARKPRDPRLCDFGSRGPARGASTVSAGRGALKVERRAGGGRCYGSMMLNREEAARFTR